MTDFYDTESSALAPIDFRSELNDEQYAAVTAKPGPALVLAGASWTLFEKVCGINNCAEKA